MSERPAPPLDAALHGLHATRRDALLLLLLAGGVLLGTWERGPWAGLGGALVCGGLFALLRLLLRQAAQAGRWLLDQPGATPGYPWLPPAWSVGLLLIGALPTSLLVARAAWQGLGSLPLTALLTLLTVGWQAWFYFWTADTPDARQQEQLDG